MYKKIMIILCVCILIFGCSKEKTSEPTAPEGIQIAEAQLNEDDEMIHNILNFDDEKKEVRITTLCFDDKQNVIDDSDSYVMVLEPESLSGWKPECPGDTASYRIDVKEIKG